MTLFLLRPCRKIRKESGVVDVEITHFTDLAKCVGCNREASSSKCGNCGCVARCHVLLEKCMYHSYCSEYDELLIVGDCINCGCAPSKHTCKTGNKKTKLPNTPSEAK
ncbi:uncharacterized protein LOC141875909 [Acropora palmata]|uniref:uncharacterized protein LOC141875909 n=1 Tax=Acropora palmata TaxID=6131 RepID=UPI003D9FB708